MWNSPGLESITASLAVIVAVTIQAGGLEVIRASSCGRFAAQQTALSWVGISGLSTRLPNRRADVWCVCGAEGNLFLSVTSCLFFFQYMCRDLPSSYSFLCTFPAIEIPPILPAYTPTGMCPCTVVACFLLQDYSYLYLPQDGGLAKQIRSAFFIVSQAGC